MPSQTYDLFARAIIERKQIRCFYNGYFRELCPIILGYSDGQEKALAYQFAGESGRGLPREGAWRCLYLSKVDDLQLCAGDWHDGNGHTRKQECVKIVDIDVNPASPYNPRRRL